MKIPPTDGFEGRSRAGGDLQVWFFHLRVFVSVVRIKYCASLGGCLSVF